MSETAASREGPGRLATLNILEEASNRLYNAMNMLQALGPAASTHHLDDLSLTLAALDRLVTTYVHQLIRSQGHDLTEKMSKSVSAHHLDKSLDVLRSQPSSRVQLHPYKGGFGGADSLLMYLCHALDNTTKCLQAAEISPWHCLRYRLLTGLLGLWVALLPARRSTSLIVSRRSRLLVSGAVLWLVRSMDVWVWRQALDKSQRQLWVVFRLWIIMDYVQHYTRMRKHPFVAHQTLIARPTADDHSNALKWRSRQLLEVVPPTSECAFWYEAAPSVALFRRGVDITYAAFGNGFRVGGSGLAWPLVGVPVALASAFYYAIRPSVAARRAAAVMSKPRLELLQRAWNAADNPLVRWAAGSLARLKGLRTQVVVELAGVRCHVLSVDPDPPLVAATSPRHPHQAPPHATAAPPAERDEQRPPQAQQQEQGHEQQQQQAATGEEAAAARDVVLFVHGGGYVAHMHCVDLPVLTAWAKRLGPSALVVVPEYTLLPHGQYPKPTNELLRVYHAISQGELGFRPRKLVVTGESAGGNLAASLVVCLILKRFSSELAGMGELYDKRLGSDDHHTPTTTTTLSDPVRQQPPRPVRAGLHEDEEEEEEEEDQSLLAGLLPTGPPPPPMAPTSLSSSSSSSSTAGPPLPLPEGLIVELESNGSSSGQEEEAVRVPDAMALFYPVLNFSLSPSPSRAVHISDPVLPLGVLTTITRAYIPKHVTDPTKDPRLSPYFCNEHILRRFPPTFLAAGGFDPLLDDTIDFDVRLEKAGASSTLRLARDLPHGFFGLYGLERSATEVIDESADFLAKALHSNPANHHTTHHQRQHG